ncbi:MAG: SMC-Scp complex subunit ScpB [Acidobacteriota bacterium]
MNLDVAERAEMEAVIEAILFVANDPVPEGKLLGVFGERKAERAQLALDAVVRRYERAEGGIMIDRAAGGLRLVSRPDLHGYLRRFFESTGGNKLSMPALETLAIIAYRQPVTAPEISELRGVSSQGVLKKLLERRLIRVSGRKEVVGKPFLYATTRDFLMHFGLRHLDELPPLEQFEEMWSGDSEARADEAPDLEEQAGQEAAAAEADDEARFDAAAEEVDERQRRQAEAAELEIDAPEPPSAESDGETGAGVGEEEDADGPASDNAADAPDADDPDADDPDADDPGAVDEMTDDPAQTEESDDGG